MAVDMFLKLEGIDGESMDDKHANEIDVLSWSWGLSNSGFSHVGGGAGAGKANFQDIAVTKYIDISSPKLIEYCAKGTHIKSATLTVRKAGGKPLEYIIIKLDEVLITSLQTGGSGGEDRLTENLSLNFAKFKIKYTEQTKTGEAGKTPDFTYNIVQNKAE